LLLLLLLSQLLLLLGKLLIGGFLGATAVVAMDTDVLVQVVAARESLRAIVDRAFEGCCVQTKIGRNC